MGNPQVALKALVTGGGGFLGRAIASALRASGAQVSSFSRGAHSELAAAGIEHIRGDIADAAAVAGAVAGNDIVFHAAALAGFWGPSRDYHRVNVVGTENVIAACLAGGVSRLVFTSSPSVVFGRGDQNGVNEEVPYPAAYLSDYSRTKAAAERLVLAADGPDLATVALRPHLIWGPGDPHLLPRFVARSRQGRLVQIGLADHLVDSIYVDNAAAAHLQAAAALTPESPLRGRAYFLSQGDPRGCWELINALLAAAGAPAVTRRTPAPAAYAAGVTLETLYRALRIAAEPPMTRFLARQLSSAHWFDVSAAQRDFGFAPLITIDEGLRRVAATFADGRQ